MAEVLEVSVGEHAGAVVVLQVFEQLLDVDTDDQRPFRGKLGGHAGHAPIPPAIPRQEQRDLLHCASGPIDLNIVEPAVRERLGLGRNGKRHYRDAGQEGDEVRQLGGRAPGRGHGQGSNGVKVHGSEY